MIVRVGDPLYNNGSVVYISSNCTNVDSPTDEQTGSTVERLYDNQQAYGDMVSKCVSWDDLLSQK